MSVMMALGRRPISMRLNSSPVTPAETNWVLFGASATVGLIGWAWIMLLALIFFAPLSSGEGIIKTALASLALLAYTSVSVAIAFLLGQLGWKESATNGFANLMGMILSFLGGAWVPLELLPSGLVAVAKFTPGYWATTMMDEALASPTVDGHSILSVLVPGGVCMLFTLALASVALMIRRSRARDELV